MRVRMLVDGSYKGEPFKKGDVIEVRDTIARAWIRHKMAEPVKDEPKAEEEKPKGKGRKSK